VSAVRPLRDVQDVDVNFYVLVPFTTLRAAEWAASRIARAQIGFDCHIVDRVAVDQSARVLTDLRHPLPGEDTAA
jgi:hypothetical protein